MAPKDRYYHAAKDAGYRSRAAYKLEQLDAEAGLLADGDVVVDLGAAPGGWLQVAAERVGSDGRVIGVDRSRIEPLEDVPAPVDTMQGDLTTDGTQDRLREQVGEAGADVVLSDMAPDMTGTYDVDHARSIHLARQAVDVATSLLGAGGDAVVKVFQGRELEDFKADMEPDFEYVRTISPDASRDASSEVYLVGKGHLTAPLRPGDVMEVEIVETGDEGDGIARVEGFTLFVPETSVGERVSVRVTAVKPRYGFASPVESPS